MEPEATGKPEVTAAPIEVRYATTLAEALEAQLRWACQLYLSPVWLSLAATGFAIVLLVTGDLPAAAVCGAGWVALPFALIMVSTRRKECVELFDGSGILSRGQPIEIRVPWTSVRRVALSGRLVVFWMGRETFLWIPGRALSAEQRKAIGSLFAAGKVRPTSEHTLRQRGFAGRRRG